MLNNQLLKYIEKKFFSARTDTNTVPLTGGDINQAYLLTQKAKKLFLKTNDAEKFPHMLQKERKGLHVLLETKTICVPEVYEAGEIDHVQFLIMQFIEPGNENDDWAKAGRALAALHKIPQNGYGWHEDNYIGSLVQRSAREDTAHAFFAGRLHERFRQCAALFSSGDRKLFDNLLSKLPALIPEEHPSLLHGDLWGGNILHGYFIDPAVYKGSREADLSMTRLFGGFPASFYAAYREVYPPADDWETRAGLWNLYPLLVHAELFGGAYIGSVRSALKKYG
ncbi:MAG: fructosamine kinase family protein [Mucilaginibacter polytrichastri]|nr:fructosamine kinase family protein [Mucilaginibacter polytrichastri]